MKQKCYIVRDLMGNYIEGLVSEETSADISEHLGECEPCSELHKAMTAPIDKKVFDYSSANMENTKKVDYLGKFHRVLKVLIAALAVIGIIAIIYTALISVLVGIFVFSDADSTATTDIAEYELYLGEEGKYKQNYLAYNDIFPDFIPDSAEVEIFNNICEDGIDKHYLSYLVHTCSDDDFTAERERLAGLDSTDYNVYGTTGFNSDYELCAVYADEYYGIIYALADDADNRLVYVAIEFTDYICDIDYDAIIDSSHLPIGFDAKWGNATRQAFDEEYGFFESLTGDTFEDTFVENEE